MYLPKNAAAIVTVDLWTKANRTVPATGGAGTVVWTWWRAGQGDTKTAFTPTAVGELGQGRYWLTIPATVPTVDGELFIAGETTTAYGDRSFHVGTLDDLLAAINVVDNTVQTETAALALALEALNTGFADLAASLLARVPAAPGQVLRPNTLTIVPGNDYDNAGQPRLQWTFTSTHNYAAGTTHLELATLAGAATPLAHTGYLTTTDNLTWTAEIQLAAAATAALPPNFQPEPLTAYLDPTDQLAHADLWKFTPSHTYHVYATDAAGKKRTLELGLLVVPRTGAAP